MRFLSSIMAGLALPFICLAQAPSPVELPAGPGLYAIFDTSMGQIVARLYEDKAPATVRNFVALATGTKATLDKKGAMVKRHYYDGLTFHRVIKAIHDPDGRRQRHRQQPLRNTESAR